ncbi:MAG: hypothetical protein IJA67_14945 [Oscillospiraceae bacterium]|nr:hypothetical protein [Oscillospiraceae bacterium]
MLVKRNLLYGLLGGLALCVLFEFVDYISLLPDEAELTMFKVSLAAAVAVGVLPIAYHYDSVLLSLGRTFVMYTAFILLFVLTVQLGVVRLLDELFGYVRYDDNYGEGMLMVFTVIAFFLGSIAANVLMPIYKYFKNRFFQRPVAE